jgi:hypothetical protein
MNKYVRHKRKTQRCCQTSEAWILVDERYNQPIPPLDENPGHGDGCMVYFTREAAVAAARYQNQNYDCNAVAVLLVIDTDFTIGVVDSEDAS